MCGITGWADRQALCPDASVLERMNNALAHRGPDGAGIHQTVTRDGAYSIALGHRRLAIIDLATGAQPMHASDQSVSLVLNGEIYNFKELRDELRALGYVFSTTSDTEVLLNAYRAWGIDCLQRCRGMFAFALWDAGRESLILARDRFGKKPLYLWQDNGRLLFASEIGALLRHPAVKAGLDRSSVMDFLQYRYVPAPHTMFQNISKLIPGSYAVWQAGKLDVQSYYLPPDGESADAEDETDAVAAFTSLLDESVRLRMNADVPFGAFLSGGLDSSAIVALMSRHSDRPVNTFSVGFAEEAYSETGYARLVAQKFKAQHHEWLMQPKDIMDLLPQALTHREAPLAEPTDIALYALSQQAAKSVKMVLSGEGADEILAGYPKHRFESCVGLYQTLMPQGVHDRLILPLVDALPPSFYRAQTLAHCFGLRDPRERMPRWFGSLSRVECNRLAALNAPARAVDARPFKTKSVSALRRCLYFDQTSWLPDNLLERGDRMTMAASLEARMPFLDHKLAGFMAWRSDQLRIRGGSQKWILRQAMQTILPREILTRSKVGFRVPVNLWFRTTLKDFVYDHLLGASSATRDFYHRDILKNRLDEHSTGRRNHEKLIWALLNLELFQKQYRLS